MLVAAAMTLSFLALGLQFVLSKSRTADPLNFFISGTSILVFFTTTFYWITDLLFIPPDLADIAFLANAWGDPNGLIAAAVMSVVAGMLSPYARGLVELSPAHRIPSYGMVLVGLLIIVGFSSGFLA